MCGLILAATVSVAGALGQSQGLGAEPIAWCDCSWIADDGQGNVFLPDGWMIPAGEIRAVRSERSCRPLPSLVGTPPDISSFDWADKVLSKGSLPKSGDFVFSTKYPDSTVHRVTSAGEEVKDGFWPRKVYAESFCVADGDLWALAGGAVRLSERLRLGKGVKLGGAYDSRVRGVARGRDGWWLATTQGAHYYPDDGGGLYAHRVGGLPQPTALALSHGRVVAVFGCRIMMFDLDDRADEQIKTAQSEWNWFVGGNWSTVVDGIDVRDGVFCLHDKTKDETWKFDPTYGENDYTRRGQRMSRSDEAVTNRMRGGKICGFETTAVAREGRWAVGYVPEKKAIVKFKVER